jgi:hypothetical protein
MTRIIIGSDIFITSNVPFRPSDKFSGNGFHSAGARSIYEIALSHGHAHKQAMDFAAKYDDMVKKAIARLHMHRQWPPKTQEDLESALLSAFEPFWSKFQRTDESITAVQSLDTGRASCILTTMFGADVSSSFSNEVYQVSLRGHVMPLVRLPFSDSNFVESTWIAPELAFILPSSEIRELYPKAYSIVRNGDCTPLTLFQEGLAAFEREDYNRAVFNFTAALFAAPKDADIHAKLAESYAEIGKLEKYAQHIRLAHSIDPGHPVINDWLAFLEPDGILP